ncbi:MAG TPA: hypothetical protein VGR71_05975 [Nitrospira sp.]|nr:hypothetical protein [Nitrospira sp.]
MITKTLAKRLERLEAELTPSDEVLTIEATFVGYPEMNRTIEWRPLTARGRRRWHGGYDKPLRLEGPGIENWSEA